MNADVFIDTNVLLYTIDEEPTSAAKRQRAQQLLLAERWGLVPAGGGRVFRQCPGLGAAGGRRQTAVRASVRVLSFSPSPLMGEGRGEGDSFARARIAAAAIINSGGPTPTKVMTSISVRRRK